MPGEVRFLDAEMIEQRDGILRPLLHRIRRRAFARADTAMVEGDGREMRRECFDLRVPKAPHTAEAGNEQQSLAAPGDVIGETAAGNFSPRHGCAWRLAPRALALPPRLHSRRSP